MKMLLLAESDSVTAPPPCSDIVPMVSRVRSPVEFNAIVP